MIPNRTQAIEYEKYPTYVDPRTPSRVPNFRLLCSAIRGFQDLPYLSIFPLTQMLKFQSAIDFVKLGRLTRKVIACISPW